MLPVKLRRYRSPGRKRLDDRACLNGILFVLKTGIPWQDLPQQLGYGSGMTCWRRLRDWNDAGVWEQLHQLLLTRLRAAEQLDWSRVVVDSSHVRALKRGNKTGAGPVDRRRAGSKHHLLTDGGGIPLAARLTGGNRNDVTQLLPWSRRSLRCGGSEADRVGARRHCSAIVAMTLTRIGRRCAVWGSAR